MLLPVLLVMLGCSPKPAAAPPLPTVMAPPPSVEPYRIQVGDELAVKFYRNADLNEDVVVRPDGMISLQLVDDVKVSGLTPGEVDGELTRRYSSELANPAVSVIVKTPAGGRIYVGGEVGRQGALRIVGDLSLFQAIQEAGGFTKTAQRSQVVLIRRDADGKAQGRLIDVRPVQTGTQPGDDILLRPFDVVFVPRSKIANVNVFVEQYIRNNLPVQNIPLGAAF
jgi:protein involved in polysaccharide export with SLBB domain